MSADNGIYILELKDQSRVIHAQAIENLWWSCITMNSSEEMIPTRIMEYFSCAKPMNSDEAKAEAFRLYDEIMDDDFFPVCEYGISKFEINKSWDEIVEDAKKVALEEIKSLKSQRDWERKKDCYKDSIITLTEFL